MALTLAENLQGSLNLVFVIISMFIGIRILSKYKVFKKRDYILIGIIWMGISTPWLHGAITFIVYYINPMVLENNAFITMRFIIAYIFIPIITVLWFIVFTDFMYQSKQKLLVSIISIICIVCELLFFIFLILDREMLIGYFNGPFTAVYSPFTRFTLIFFLVISFITFMMFAGKSLKSTELEVKWKGRFLILAFLIYTTCAVLDSFAIFLTQPLIVVLIRVFLIISAIFFYFGWILPSSIKNALKKE